MGTIAEVERESRKVGLRTQPVTDDTKCGKIKGGQEAL
jgi:hypothetical protein